MNTKPKYLTNGEIFQILLESMNRTPNKEIIEEEKDHLESLFNLPYEDIEKFFTDSEYYENFIKNETNALTTNGLKIFGCFVLNGYLLGHKHGRDNIIDEMLALSLESAESEENTQS